ncbi:MAG: hypothetical protein WBH65_07885, partial [Dethiobacteria bacterium]
RGSFLGGCCNGLLYLCRNREFYFATSGNLTLQFPVDLAYNKQSNWMAVLLLEELRQVGIPHDHILFEQQIGGDELDVIVNISEELVLFELKGKEFSLGNAYSFGSKIGIVRPNHSVIFTIDYVGGDARGHFERGKVKVLYIEG